MSSLEQITRAAELRGSRARRRADGSYFTDSDVALHLAERAICARLLDAAHVPGEQIAGLLDGSRDPWTVLHEVAANADARRVIAERTGSLVVLDPTCGAGSFLTAAWDVLVRVEEELQLGAVASPAQLHGVDLEDAALEACALALAERTGARSGAPSLRHGDALEPGMLPAADVILGNPPYVRAATADAPADLVTRTVPNRSAWIVERALDAARPGARVAFVLPISTVCTDAFEPARRHWSATCDTVHASHFDTIPATLFAGVVQRLTILEGRVAAEPAEATWFTTRYHRWTRAERDGLLVRVRHVPMPPQRVAGSLPKIGSSVEAGLLDLLFRHPPAARLLERPDRDTPHANRIWYKRRWSYFLLFTDFVPEMWDADGVPRPPTEFKPIDVVAEVDARVLLSIFSSTLFWWYFSVFTDNRNVNRRDLRSFPVPTPSADVQRRLAALGSELMDALRACAEVRTCTYRSVGTIRNTYFRQGATRPVLDRIDRVLAEAYGMDDEQLAFVLGYERRFRGGELSPTAVR